MVVRKIIERILEEGQTSITITDTDIPGSLVRTYSNDPDLMPTQVVLTGSTLKIDYEAQTSDKYVAVELVKQGLDIIDNLTSTDTDAALSAKQGKVLKDLVDDITPITELTELDDVSAEDPQTGDILKYNGTSEKWEKYNLPDIPVYLEDLGDVSIDTVTTGQVLTFNGAYWTNATPTGGGNNYSTTETVIGTWTDGKPLYQITKKLTSGIAIGTYGTIDLPSDIIVRDMKGYVYRNNYQSVDMFNGYINNGDIFVTIRNGDIDYMISNAFSNIIELDITVQYTKTTD